MRPEEKISKLQVNMTPGQLEELEQMMDKLKAGTKTEVVKSSLKLMRYAVEEKSKGGEIILRDKNGREKVLII